jgi:RNA polymerase sigma-70 factor (ECF subfamily)
VYLPNDGDDELVRRCLEGEPVAFERLVAKYQKPLYNVAFRLLGNRADATDATQNAFVSAYEHLGSFDRERRFFSWIFRILKNECLNVLRGRRPTEPVDPDLASEGRPDRALDEAERDRAVQAALLKLSSDYREVIVLRHFAEFSYDEIAAALDIPVKTVKSRLYTARQHLGELLADWQVRR